MSRFRPALALLARTQIVEPYQINILAFAVLGDLKQIDDTQESRLPRQLRRNIRETDRRDGIHFDLTFFHSVSVACFDVGTRPYSDAASDFSATDALAETLGEDHDESLHAAGGSIIWELKER